MPITARVIADSVGETAPRLTTLQLRYPRFIHPELLTHRVFSRNASSSRAIPIKKLIEEVEKDPVFPVYWGKNKPGMQAEEECDEMVDSQFREWAWRNAMKDAVKHARKFEEAGYHKQIVNRLIEPFAHIHVVLSGTDWKNFFNLRRHKDAQPEIKALADEIFYALDGSKPDTLDMGDWHLPFVMSHENYLDINTKIKVSVARCARVSYYTRDGNYSSVDDDLKLYNRLVGSQPIHASPAEHQATPCNVRNGHGNFSMGWLQYRKILEGDMT